MTGRATNTMAPSLSAVRVDSPAREGCAWMQEIVELPNDVRYVLCVMTEGSKDHLYRPDHDGATLNGRLSRLIFDAWWPSSVAMPAG